MKKPISLFGVESKQQTCYFIHHEGFGYWFISLKQRTVGEASSLTNVVSKIERLEVDNNLLILDICKENKSYIAQNYLTNSTPVDDKEKFENEIKSDNYSTDFNLKLENYVRELLSAGDIQHPVLYPYRDRIVSRLSNSIMFDYQLQVVICALKHRLVLEEKYIKVDENDGEKGYVLFEDIKNHQIIGEPRPDLDAIGEQLTLQIYNFVTTDFAGKDWLTSKGKEKSVVESTPTPIPASTSSFSTTDEEDKEWADILETETPDEKKPVALTVSEP